MNNHPLSVRVLIVVATVWFSLNAAVLTFNLVSQWYIAALQAPNQIQQANARAEALQRELAAERAKPKGGATP